MLSPLIKRQYRRTHEQHKQKDGNSKKEQKEMLEIKNTVTGINTIFDGLI